MPLPCRSVCALALAGLAAVVHAQPPAPGPGAVEISPAQRAVFTDHLQNAQPGTTLEYRYTHRGLLDSPFDDTVKLIMLPEDAAPRKDGGRPTAVAFLTGSRRSSAAPVGDPTGNPVILHFLERDSLEMERLTGGKAGYHRRRVKIALAEGKTVEPIEIDWEGRKVAAKRITITPYQDFADADLKPKYGQLLGKRYEFVVADAIPGSLYALRAYVPGSGDTPLVDDTLTFIGVKHGVAQAPTAPPGTAPEPAK